MIPDTPLVGIRVFESGLLHQAIFGQTPLSILAALLVAEAMGLTKTVEIAFLELLAVDNWRHDLDETGGTQR